MATTLSSEVVATPAGNHSDPHMLPTNSITTLVNTTRHNLHAKPWQPATATTLAQKPWPPIMATTLAQSGGQKLRPPLEGQICPFADLVRRPVIKGRENRGGNR